MEKLSPTYVDAVRSLSDRDMHIYTTEVDRRKKSVAVAYLLWFFFGLLGVHRFYLNQTLGLANLGAFIFTLFVLPNILEATGWVMPLLMFLCLAYLALSLLIDLFTIPWQVNRANEQTAENILANLVKQGQSNVPAPPNPQPH